MKVLFLRPDKAGDALKSLPVLRALKRRYPEWEVHILCSPHNRSLFECEAGMFSHLEIPRFEFDKAISLLCDPDRKVLTLLKQTWAKSRISPAFIDGSLDPAIEIIPLGNYVGRDEVCNIQKIVEGAFAIPLQPIAEKPTLTTADRAEASQVMGDKSEGARWIGLCPFSGLPHRQLPLTRWNRFLSYLEKDHRIDRLFVFGLKEELSRLSSRQAHKITPTSFRTMGAYFEKLNGVIGVDSGPLHLAISGNIPVLGFLSGGDYKRWFATLPPHSRLLRRGWLGKFPETLRMRLAYRSWSAELPSVTSL